MLRIVLVLASTSFALDVCNQGVKLHTNYADPDTLVYGVEKYCESKPCDTISIIFSNYVAVLNKNAETKKSQGTYLANQKAGEQCIQAGQQPGSAYCVRLVDEAMANVNAQYSADMAYANETRRWFTEVELAMTFDKFCTSGSVAIRPVPRLSHSVMRSETDALGRDISKSPRKALIFRR